MSAGPLAGVRVVELTDEKGPFAGKLFADAGAEVVKIEPPGGDPTRNYAPFVDDTPDPERSLWFWHYNTSKLGVTLDVDAPRGRQLLLRLLDNADVFIESLPPRRLAALGISYDVLRERNPRLVMVSMTPFGPEGPRANDPVTDLTILAGGGPVWSCGYDDHALPPVRGGGNQGFHTGCHFAVIGALTALLCRHETGEGQHVEVNMNAAANVTTEAASYSWLVAKQTVQRQTGRHAAMNPTLPTQIRCADGAYATTGLAPRKGADYRKMIEWLAEIGILANFPGAPFLEMGAERDVLDFSQIGHDEVVAAIFEAGRSAVVAAAEALPAYEFFQQGQQRGFQVGIIYSPDEFFEDPHAVARGFQVEVDHPEIGRTVKYPGAPYQMRGSPWTISRRAPLAGEDNERVYGALGLSTAEIASLRADGVI